MSKQPYMEEQTVSEFDFSIEIKSDENNDFFFIRKKVSQVYYRYYSIRQNSIQREVEFSNVPYLILKSSFDRHFRFLGQGKAYLTNYSEKEGSFIVEFTILILQSSIAYGGIRGTIDYFVDDLEHLFTNSLPRDFETKVNYKERKSYKRKNNGNEQHLISLLEPLERKIFINRIVIGLILFFLILSITYILNTHDQKNSFTREEFDSNTKSEPTINPLKDTKIEIFINEKRDTIR